MEIKVVETTTGTHLEAFLQGAYNDGWRLIHVQFFDGADNYQPSFMFFLERSKP